MEVCVGERDERSRQRRVSFRIPVGFDIAVYTLSHSLSVWRTTVRRQLDLTYRIFEWRDKEQGSI